MKTSSISNQPSCCSRLLAAGLFFTASALAQVNVLTANYDNVRTNSNLNETTLNQRNVNTSSFGKLGYFPVDGEIYAQPLYATGIQITGQGKHNVVYLATMHNSVYAIDADTPNSATALWHVNLGPSVPSSVLNFTDILPEVGVLSTPVIDLTRQIIYLVSDTLEGGTPTLRLHALSLADGSEMLNGPVLISASVHGNGAGNTGGTLAFDPAIHLQRPGLVLANGRLYLAFGSRGDLDNWHGWLMSYDPATLNQLAVVCTSPDGYGASVWQAGRAPIVDDAGNLYVVTGNGDFDGSVNFGESILKWAPDLTLLDYFTPSTYAYLTDQDLDFGSAGAILVEATKQLLAIGKTGELYLVNSNAMGHLDKNNTAAQRIQANQGGTFDMALWNSPSGPIFYPEELGGPLQAYQIVNGKLNATLMSQATPQLPSVFAGIAVSGDGRDPASTVVWETTANFLIGGRPGTLHAFDASDLSHELWNSDMVPSDALGRFAKFVAPTVANGKVYVPTFSNELAIYGLLSGVPPPESGPPQITSVANGASFLSGAVAGGELVVISGANLGPVLPAGAQVDSTGHLTSVLAHTKVLFDGIAAPLLLASAKQINALVPFGVTGPAVDVQVQNGSQFSAAFTIPVVAASPALFSADGTGGELGAIINQDGKMNSFDDPAPKGSVVMMYATGFGQTKPGGNDGQIINSGPYPAPLLPVKVLIDGQAANVLYAGQAPQMVQGVIQINARIPSAASSGQVQIVVKVGESTSPNTVTIVVK